MGKFWLALSDTYFTTFILFCCDAQFIAVNLLVRKIACIYSFTFSTPVPKPIPPEFIRKAEATPLQEAISRMLQVYGLSEKYEEVQVTQALREILEATFGNQIGDIFIRNNQVFVKLNSAPLRKELSMWRDQLLLRLQEKEPKAVNIRAIVLI